MGTSAFDKTPFASVLTARRMALVFSKVSFDAGPSTNAIRVAPSYLVDSLMAGLGKSFARVEPSN